MYTNLGLATLTDADLAAYAPFASFKAADLQAAGAAIVAIVGTVGDYATTNSNANKLLRIVNSVPK